MKNKLIILASFLSLSLNAIALTEAQYQSMSPARKSYLQQRAYREVLNPQNVNYQLAVIQLLEEADILTGAGRTSRINEPETPYHTTAKDNRTAYDIYRFVESSPAGTINEGLESWALSGIQYLNHRLN